MNPTNDSKGNGQALGPLQLSPPFVWPESRWHASRRQYEHHFPTSQILKQADILGGLLVDASDGAIEWVSTLLNREGPIRLRLILLVYPTCSTRQDVLQSLLEAVDQCGRSDEEVQLRVLTASTWAGSGLPPTAMLAHVSATGESWLCLGSIGDIGHQEWHLTSLNIAFRPDDKFRAEFRRWLDYLWNCASPLTLETAEIPHLVVPKGDPEAWSMWEEYERLCLLGKDLSRKVAVDPDTGEVTTVDGKPQSPEETWDGGATKLDPLAQILNDVYSRTWLVTVDETTRIKPLTIPVKATLLGQQAESIVGALKHKQQFSLDVLDADVAKEVEKCRLVTDAMELLSYPLSKGNRLIPEAAKTLLEKELEARNQRATKSLQDRLGGGVATFVEARKGKYRKDLDQKYQELGQGREVPEDKVKTILTEVEARLTRALTSRVTPRAIYNRLAPPDLTAKAPDENWGQAFSLLIRAARQLRKSRTDAYFRRNFGSLPFTQEVYEAAMDIFGDEILKSDNLRRAQCELEALDRIEQSEASLKEKCHKVWDLIAGKLGQAPKELQPETHNG